MHEWVPCEERNIYYIEGLNEIRQLSVLWRMRVFSAPNVVLPFALERSGFHFLIESYHNTLKIGISIFSFTFSNI